MECEKEEETGNKNKEEAELEDRAQETLCKPKQVLTIPKDSLGRWAKLWYRPFRD